MSVTSARWSSGTIRSALATPPLSRPSQLHEPTGVHHLREPWASSPLGRARIVIRCASRTSPRTSSSPEQDATLLSRSWFAEWTVYAPGATSSPSTPAEPDTDDITSMIVVVRPSPLTPRPARRGQPDRKLASKRAGGGAPSQTRDQAGSRRDDCPGALHALPTEPPPA
jgi:hypothetical protein